VSPARGGLLVVDKPGGMTSHDVVAAVRRLTGTRKVGHAGTLDPMATGILILGIGRATRLLGHLALTEKTYQATVRLGLATTTDDAEGEPLGRVAADHVDEDRVRDSLAGMVGELDQVPSAVSAVKVGGRRSYERVRAGEQVSLPARRVTIHELWVHGVQGVPDPDGQLVDVDLTVRCSSGTYVRALARDLGAALGVGGHLTRLRRTAVGSPGHGVTLTEAVGLDELAQHDEAPLLPMGEAARRFFCTVTVDEADARAVGHGRRLLLRPEPADADPVAVLDTHGDLLALYRRLEPNHTDPSDHTDHTEDAGDLGPSHAPLAVLV
jgi:tRNA pseudouridine55 synthase